MRMSMPDVSRLLIIICASTIVDVVWVTMKIALGLLLSAFWRHSWKYGFSDTDTVGMYMVISR